jgi:dynein heavy chain
MVFGMIGKFSLKYKTIKGSCQINRKYRRENHSLEIVDTFIVSAMGPSGGGRNKITPRLSRHFNVISIESFNNDLMRSIFYPIIDWHFQKPGFPVECRKYSRV